MCSQDCTVLRLHNRAHCWFDYLLLYHVTLSEWKWIKTKRYIQIKCKNRFRSDIFTLIHRFDENKSGSFEKRFDIFFFNFWKNRIAFFPPLENGVFSMNPHFIEAVTFFMLKIYTFPDSDDSDGFICVQFDWNTWEKNFVSCCFVSSDSISW